MKGATVKASTNDSKLKSKGSKIAKKQKDPNKPKRPPSAFFVFLGDFRKEFNKANPGNKSVAEVGKAAGIKWKSMTEADKSPYVAKAEKRKSDYDVDMQAYNKKLAGGPSETEEESDKCKSEVQNIYVYSISFHYICFEVFFL